MNFHLKHSIMRKILFLITVSTTFLLAAKSAFAQKKNQLEGVWKIVEVVVPSQSTGKDTTISTPQPGVLILTKGYYSIIAIQSGRPRSAPEQPKDAQNLTDAERSPGLLSGVLWWLTQAVMKSRDQQSLGIRWWQRVWML